MTLLPLGWITDMHCFPAVETVILKTFSGSRMLIGFLPHPQLNSLTYKALMDEAPAYLKVLIDPKVTNGIFSQEFPCLHTSCFSNTAFQ